MTATFQKSPWLNSVPILTPNALVTVSGYQKIVATQTKYGLTKAGWQACVR
jgi:hypothetical protein